MEDSTPLDEHIQSSIWSSVIPIELKLAPDDTATPIPPEPYYLLVPRIGYLSVATSSAESYFSEYVASRFDGMWFKYQNIPLKWNLPIGVLYDLYGKGQLPWSIEVNFQNFPANTLQRWENEDELKAHYMNNLKEANHLKDKNNTAINGLTKDEQTNLWEAIKSQKYAQFWDIYPKLCKSIETIKFVPVRIITENGHIMMSPITSRYENGDVVILKDVLCKKFPEFESDDCNLSAIVHGISPPLDTPIYWLATHCIHPDNFLYIIIVSKQK